MAWIRTKNGTLLDAVVIGISPQKPCLMANTEYRLICKTAEPKDSKRSVGYYTLAKYETRDEAHTQLGEIEQWIASGAEGIFNM